MNCCLRRIRLITAITKTDRGSDRRGRLPSPVSSRRGGRRCRSRLLACLLLLLTSMPLPARSEPASQALEAAPQADCSAPTAGPVPMTPVQLDQEDIVSYTRKYVSTIQQKIQDNWLIPKKNLNNFKCIVYVRQRPDGCVLQASVVNCGSEVNLIRSVLSAINRASPLPRPEYPQVFDSELILTFQLD